MKLTEGGEVIQHKPRTWEPAILEKIFAVNEFDANKMIEHNIYEETIISYENVFKYPHEVKKYLLKSPAPRWKHRPGGKNFDEYWDCRHHHLFEQVLELYKIIDKIIYLTYSYSLLSNDSMIINEHINGIASNLFQWKDRPPLTNIPDCFGNQPHADFAEYVESAGAPRYAMTVGLNDEEDIRKNGIGFYESVHGIRTQSAETAHLILTPDNVEDGRSYYNEYPENHWKLPPKFIEHDFNKVIIYPGYLFHGAYHDKLDFIEYPRITMVSFL